MIDPAAIRRRVEEIRKAPHQPCECRVIAELTDTITALLAERESRQGVTEHLTDILAERDTLRQQVAEYRQLTTSMAELPCRKHFGDCRFLSLTTQMCVPCFFRYHQARLKETTP